MDAQGTADLVITLLHSATTAHLLHFGTRSFAAHKALDEFYSAMPGLVDDLVEAWQGRNSTLLANWSGGYQVTKLAPLEYVESISAYFIENRAKIGTGTELQNICDEIQSLIDSTLYKLRFLS